MSDLLKKSEWNVIEPRCKAVSIAVLRLVSEPFAAACDVTDGFTEIKKLY
jgi:hypothetical protein